MEYKPVPLDTTDVVLPGDILELVERLARNVHEIWSVQRMAEGWSYGPRFNEKKKERPDLVPYDELSDSEQEYDRITALGTLKSMVVLGYSIDRTPEAGQIEENQMKELAALLQLTRDPTKLDLNTSIEFWQARNSKSWSKTAKIYQRLGNQILRLGEPLLAYDVVKEGLKHWPMNSRLRQLAAMALLRSGATAKAMAILEALYEEGVRDEETIGVLARAHKDLAESSRSDEQRNQHWQMSYKLYLQAFEDTGGYWTGVNAAALAKMFGDREKAFDLARTVRQIILDELDNSSPESSSSYWLTATLAETALIMEEFEDCIAWYEDAARLANRRFGDLTSTRRNARLIMDNTEIDVSIKERIENSFNIPNVVVFESGLLKAGTLVRQFRSPGLEEKIKEEIRSRIEFLDGRVGYSTIASMIDVIFLETVLDIGGEIHIVLPYTKDKFLKDLSKATSDTGLNNRIKKILGRAAEVIHASEHPPEVEPTSGTYLDMLLIGLAKIRAEQLETELIPLVVAVKSETYSSERLKRRVPLFKQLGLEENLIELDESLVQDSLKKSSEPEIEPALVDKEAERGEKFELGIKAILFADAVGFSQLNENQTVLFVRHFLGSVGNLISSSGYNPLTRETWGDGLYFVFNEAREAGKFALDLSKLVSGVNWPEKGLPEDLSLRIALHAGPIYSCINPLNGNSNFIGTHVTKTARIEPVTPPNHVYASQAFVALAVTEKVDEFTYDYVGQTPLAKGYGTLPMYHLRQSKWTD